MVSASVLRSSGEKGQKPCLLGPLSELASDMGQRPYLLGPLSELASDMDEV
jgi:hypothetical protein